MKDNLKEPDELEGGATSATSAVDSIKQMQVGQEILLANGERLVVKSIFVNTTSFGAEGAMFKWIVYCENIDQTKSDLMLN